MLRSSAATAAVAGAAASGAGVEPVTGQTTAAEADATETPSGGTETHTVDMTDSLVFKPKRLSIAPGDTVVWENVGSLGHSVTAYEDEIPDGADYFASGGFDGEQAARDAYTTGDPESGDIPGGESYEHTFETEGVYEYFCIPHEAAGMVGTIAVGDVPGADAGGGGGDTARPAPPGIPGGEFGLVVAALFFGLSGLAVLGAAGPEVRRLGRGFYHGSRRLLFGGGGHEAVTDAPALEQDRTLTHDEYDPTGTAALIVAYLLILVAMWIFMYFVEFLGNGPTIIG
jgi:plastocyanin